jgi:hypothetical protein
LTITLPAPVGPVTKELTPTAGAAASSFSRWLVRYRLPLLGAFVGVSALLTAILGLPERPYVLMWVTALCAIAFHDSPWKVGQVIYDWLPILVIAAGYDLVRSFASDLVPRAVVEPQLRFDEILFGGTAPTVVLQRWLDARAGLHPYDYLAFLFYLSHFVVTPSFAVFLYLRDRPAFRRFKWCMLTVCIAGFITYFALPAEPPWRASEQGELQPTVRVVQEVWADLGLSGAAKAFAGKDTEVANPVAALPSLHAAWPLMVLLFMWPRYRRGRWVFLAYNGVMCSVLVYGAEHYVSDIALGWLYTAVVFVVVNRVIDHRDAARLATA